MATYSGDLNLWRTYISCLIMFILLSCCHGNPFQRQEITLSNGAYAGILVAIAERVPKENSVNILKNIQEYFRNASRVLHKATREQVYFGQVTILVPQSWGNGAYEAAGKAAFQHANVIIDESNPAYGNTPYVLRTLPQCGVGGEYIHLTPNYILYDYSETYGDPGKVIVHEWSHMRWGLGDEYPRPERNEARFFLGPGINNWLTPYPVACSKGIKGRFKNSADGKRGCYNDRLTKLPDENCYFIPYKVNQPANASLMYDQTLSSVHGFCDNLTDEKEAHVEDAPNEQNLLCKGKSAWEVMRAHPDFSGSGSNKVTALEPTFRLVQRKMSDRVVLVLDVSGSMSKTDYGDTTRLEKLRSDATLYLRSAVVEETLVGIVMFSTTAVTLSDLILIDGHREELVSKIPTATIASTCIGCGLLEGIKVLEKVGDPAGGNLLLISDGQDNVPDEFAKGQQEVSQKEVIVDSVLYTDNADSKLISLARNSSGRVYFDQNMEGSTSLLQALLETVSSRQEPGVRTYPLQVFLDTVQVQTNANSTVTFSIDDTVGDKTQISLTYPPGVMSTAVSLSVEYPSGITYVSSDTNVAIIDTDARIINLKLPGVAPVGMYTVRVSHSGNSKIHVQLLVLSRAISTSVDVLTVKSYISQDQVDFHDVSTIYMKIVAHVTKGYSPVLGANVTAYVTWSKGMTSVTKLRDLGIGADVNLNDGVYTGYFLNYVDDGKYSVKVKVSNSGGDAKVVTSGATGAFYQPDFNDSSTFNGPIQTDDIVPFDRSASSGFFTANNVIKGGDMFPPGKVTDLRLTAMFYSNFTIKLQWTAMGDDLDSNGPASAYELRYCESSKQLRNDFSTCTLITQASVLEGNLSSPAEPYTLETFVIRLPEVLANTTYYWGVVLLDDGGLRSDLSNILAAGIYFVEPDLDYTTEGTTPTSGTSKNTTTLRQTSLKLIMTSESPRLTRKDVVIIGATVGSFGFVIVVILVALVGLCLHSASRSDSPSHQTVVSKTEGPNLPSKVYHYGEPYLPHAYTKNRTNYIGKSRQQMHTYPNKVDVERVYEELVYGQTGGHYSKKSGNSHKPTRYDTRYPSRY